MALLQIAEPGQATAPHKHRLAVGIDLGTTNSLVATVRNGIAVCLTDGQGRSRMPSVVHYREDGGIELGFNAMSTHVSDPRNT
ncbi:MAG: Hsp70 family protein, partial [Proteobacteria bacterium]|nr:Hsp70 family protein [Pseudomonadota bacterium]